ncbi:hypothetical protein DL93DRAFT_1882217 [Clavulina sp. PMI_390]|nr:hypothetical protein DL93DRAFT_1882217 [Clavulina sp. PMI_390]
MMRRLAMKVEGDPNVRVLLRTLRFWRELGGLYASNGGFSETLYPNLTEAVIAARQGIEIAFIVSDEDENNVMGSHWTACVLDVRRRTYRFGDSLDMDPPPALQPCLENWLYSVGLLPPGEPLRRDRDLEHRIQADASSCGFIAVNMLEHYVLPDQMIWTPHANAHLRVAKYIELMAYNPNMRVVGSCCALFILMISQLRSV